MERTDRNPDAPTAADDHHSDALLRLVLAIVGERWTLQTVAALSRGTCRFNGIQCRTGAPRDLLTARLRKLESNGIVVRRCYNSNPVRYEYHLTGAGRALVPIIDVLEAWGEEFLNPPPDSAG